MSKRKDSIYKKVKQNWQRQCADVREHNKKITRQRKGSICLYFFCLLQKQMRHVFMDFIWESIHTR